MPQSPKVVCPCGGRRRPGQPCERCGYGKKHDGRSAATIHFNNVMYGRKWKEFRRVYLACNPLCRDCQAAGIVAAATEPHHLKKVKDFPELQYDYDNLVPLWKRHHSEHSTRRMKDKDYGKYRGDMDF